MKKRAIYASMAAALTQPFGTQAETPPSDCWCDRTEIAGLIELEAAYHRPGSGSNESDLTLATFELGVVSQINDRLQIGGTLLYEEDDTPLEVDTAYVAFGMGEGNAATLTAGQFYVPFGAYQTHMISDPLTLAIGETRETALQAEFGRGNLGGALYLFNGDTKKGDSDSLNSWGASLDYAVESDNFDLTLGAGYINNLGDSDSLQEVIAGTSGGNSVDRQTGAYTLNTLVETGPFSLIGEYLAASDEFAATEVHWNGNGARPRAWTIEAGYTFAMNGRESTFAMGYQASDEALALGLPRRRILAALATAIDDHTAIAIEWARDIDYGSGDSAIDADGNAITGSGEESDTLTLRLAVNF